MRMRAANPWSNAGYFGGAVRFDYSLFDAWWNPTGIPAGAEIELQFSPETGTTLYGETRSFIVTKTVGNSNDGVTVIYGKIVNPYGKMITLISLVQ